MLVKTNRYMKMHGETIKIVYYESMKLYDENIWTSYGGSNRISCCNFQGYDI